MQRRFQQASLAPSDFAVDEATVVAERVQVRIDHARFRGHARHAGDRAAEFKADIYAGLLTYPLVVSEWSC